MKKRFIITATSALVCGGILLSSFVQEKNDQQSENIVSASNVSTENSMEDIHYKMLNSIDYFESAKGSFVRSSEVLGYTDEIDYQVKLKNKPVSKVKIKRNGNDELETLYSDTELSTKDFMEKSIRKEKIEKAESKMNQKEKQVSSRYLKLDNGKKVYQYRDDPSFMGRAAISLFPQELATGFLEDYSKWSVSENKQINNLDAVVIKGHFNDDYQQRFNAKTFELDVHTETGVLLGYRFFDENNKVNAYMETKSIKLNTSIEEKEFKLSNNEKFKEVNY